MCVTLYHILLFYKKLVTKTNWWNVDTEQQLKKRTHKLLLGTWSKSIKLQFFTANCTQTLQNSTGNVFSNSFMYVTTVAYNYWKTDRHKFEMSQKMKAEPRRQRFLTSWPRQSYSIFCHCLRSEKIIPAFTIFHKGWYLMKQEKSLKNNVRQRTKKKELTSYATN